MPQARHGGIGKAELAVAASKLEGTVFENEQMGHIQVPVASTGSAAVRENGRGLLLRDTGDDDDNKRVGTGDTG